MTKNTIDVSGYSGGWVTKALARMKRDGEVVLKAGTDAIGVTWLQNADNETRLVQAAAKMKGHRK